MEEAPDRFSVNFEPMKKMKKRRDLDALVNGKMGRRRKKGQHELLRNESESSEVEEFSIPEEPVMRKSSSSCRFCVTCMAVCGLFLVAACIVAIGGLVWVHLELKKEVDQLRTQVGQVQLNAPQSAQKVEKLLEQQQLQEQNDKQLWQNEVTLVKANISRLAANVSSVTSGIVSLNQNVNVLKGSIVTAAAKLDDDKLMQLINQSLSTVYMRMYELEHTITTLVNSHSDLEAQLASQEISSESSDNELSSEEDHKSTSPQDQQSSNVENKPSLELDDQKLPDKQNYSAEPDIPSSQLDDQDVASSESEKEDVLPLKTSTEQNIPPTTPTVGPNRDPDVPTTMAAEVTADKGITEASESSTGDNVNADHDESEDQKMEGMEEDGSELTDHPQGAKLEVPHGTQNNDPGNQENQPQRKRRYRRRHSLSNQ